MRNGAPSRMLDVEVAIGLARKGRIRVKEVLGMALCRGG
jgi:hypothetical protein